MALLAAAENQLDVYEYSSNEIKSAVVGYGHATKEQVQKWSRRFSMFREKMAADAADALAAAVCHVHRQAFQARIMEAAPDWRPAMRRRRLP